MDTVKLIMDWCALKAIINPDLIQWMRTFFSFTIRHCFVVT